MTTDRLVIISFILLGEILLAILICRAVLQHLDEPEEVSEETQKTIDTLDFVIRILHRCAVGAGLLSLLLILVMLALVR